MADPLPNQPGPSPEPSPPEHQWTCASLDGQACDCEPSPPGPELPQWEEVADRNTVRLPVPGGWLYHLSGGPMCFVPNPPDPAAVGLGRLF